MDMFDRTGAVSPFLLVDGHHSRFELPFLQYICNLLHLWAVCIGVPYDMTLWQVGDAPEQNSSLNTASVVKKREIFEDKEKHMLNKLTIEPHNIIMILNYAWERSFARVISNKKSIAEREWFPYNHNLTTYLIIRSSIMK